MLALNTPRDPIAALTTRLVRMPRSDTGFMDARYTLVLTAVMFPAEAEPASSEGVSGWYEPPTQEVGPRTVGDPAWSRAVRVHILIQTFEERPALSTIGMLLRSGRAIEVLEEQLAVDRRSQIQSLTVVEPDQAESWTAKHARGEGYECGAVTVWISAET